MFTVVNNEFVKMFKGSKKFRVFLVILISLSIIYSIIYKATSNSNEVYNIVLNNINMYLEIIPIYIAILTSDVITEDYRMGTLKITVLRPVSRGNIIMGKILFVVLSMGLIIMFNIMFSTLFSAFIFKISMPTTYELIELLLRGVLTTFVLGAFGTVLVFMSLLTNSSGVATGLGIGVLFGMKIVSAGIMFVGILPQYLSGIFITNSFSMFTKAVGAQDEFMYTVSFLMVLVYYIVFSILSIKTFKTKDLLH